MSQMSIQRLEPPYENRSKQFYHTNQTFLRQYFHIYEARLTQLGALLKKKVSDKYGEFNHASINKILNNLLIKALNMRSSKFLSSEKKIQKLASSLELYSRIR
jgi:hypothetical protein